MTVGKGETDKILEGVLEGIQRIKGKEITIVDLNTINHTECGYFVICHGTSTTQTNSIALSVEETVKETTGLTHGIKTDTAIRFGFYSITAI
jgi:ribosome-associated protein